MAKTSVHSLALPSPQKANGFSGTPEVLTEKVRISKHLLHQEKEIILLSVKLSLFLYGQPLFFFSKNPLAFREKEVLWERVLS